LYFNKTTNQYNKKSGTLITAFLHNLPYQSDDIQTLLSGGRNKYYFGGHKGVAQKYINSIGNSGLPSLPEPGPILFRLLKKSVTQAAKQVEAKHKSGFIGTHVKQFTQLFGPPAGRWKIQTNNKADVALIQADPGNKKEIRTVYGPPTNKVNQNYSQRLTIQRYNGLI